MRGFASIGLQQPKTAANVAGIIRTAGNFGAKLVVIESPRLNAFTEHSANTMKAHRHYVPTIKSDNLFDQVPASAKTVAIELIDNALPLPKFHHPENAFYIFGPEDGSIASETLIACDYVVYVPTFHCMNLATTVGVVLYDRSIQYPSSVL